jgi:hypothetical protein
MAFLLKRRNLGSELGAEVIEFAIVLPLMLLIIFGIVDFGFLFQRYVVLTNAAMEGARVRTLPGYEDPDAILRARSYAVDGGVAGAQNCPPLCIAVVPVLLPGTGGVANWPGYTIQVNYIHQYSYIGPIASMFGGSFSSVTLKANATMRRQTK